MTRACPFGHLSQLNLFQTHAILIEDLYLCCSVEQHSISETGLSRCYFTDQTGMYGSQRPTVQHSQVVSHQPITHTAHIYSMEAPILPFSHSCPAYRLLRLWCRPCQEQWHSSLSLSLVLLAFKPFQTPVSCVIRSFQPGNDNLAFEGFSVTKICTRIRNLTRSVHVLP